MPAHLPNSIRKVVRTAFVLVTSVHAGVALAHPATTDRLVRSAMAREHIPGVQIAVVRNGKLLKSASYGFANAELAAPVNSHSFFDIASMSKTFTDAGILLLAEDGKLALDDPVTKYLSGLPHNWDRMTLRELMLHTSGLPDDWDEDDDYFLKNTSNEDFLRALAAGPLKFSPGERFSYGCGPFILGMVIEKVSGKPYAKFLQDRIFAPLGMNSTHVNDARLFVRDRASGYSYEDGALKGGHRISPAAEARGDIGIGTTALDLVKWTTALDRHRLLRSGSLEKMFSPGRLKDGTVVPDGLGWFMLPNSGNVWEHGGRFRTGFSSFIGRYPGRLTVIVLTNMQSANPDRLGSQIAAAYDWRYPLLSIPRADHDPAPARTKRIQSFVAALAAGVHLSSEATADFPFELYTPDTLDWFGIKETGALSYRGCNRFTDRHSPFFRTVPKQVCYYRTGAEDGHSISIALDRNGKVQFIDYVD